MDEVSRVRPSLDDPDSPDHDTISQRSRSECWTWFCVHSCSHAGLAALVVAYSLLGAVIFELVEGGASSRTPEPPSSASTTTGEERRGLQVQRSREDCLRELWTITERLNVLYERNWTRLVHEQLRKFEVNVMAATQLGSGGQTASPSPTQHHQHQPQHWSFGGALLYSVTVITTIGYGNLSPRTSLGKVLTMIYATIGVPLMLLCLSSLGQLLARSVQFLYVRLTCKQRELLRARENVTGHCHARTEKTPTRRNDYKYQRAPTSPGRSSCASTHDSSVIQISTPHKTPPAPPPPQLTPRKSALATVNSSHTRARCRLLSTHAPVPPPPPPPTAEQDDPDETDDTESGLDLVNKKFDVTMSYPICIISGTYDVAGKLLGLQLVDTGTVNVTFVEPVNLLSFNYELKNKRGKQYINILECLVMNKDVKRIYFQVQLSRNKQIGDGINSALNENWKEIADEVRNSVSGAIGGIIKAILQPFFDRVPYDDFFAKE